MRISSRSKRLPLSLFVFILMLQSIAIINLFSGSPSTPSPVSAQSTDATFSQPIDPTPTVETIKPITVDTPIPTPVISPAIVNPAPTSTALKPKPAATSTPAPKAPPTPTPNPVPTPVPAPKAPTPAPVTAQPKATNITPGQLRINIPSIGVNTQIITVGVAADGNVDVPAHLAGWYSGSVWPGNPGASFIDGHRNNNGPGVFYSLPKVGIGQEIDIYDGIYNKTLTYKVTQNTIYATKDLPMEQLIFGNAGGTNIIHLITCAGSYANGTYTQRALISATLVSSN